MMPLFTPKQTHTLIDAIRHYDTKEPRIQAYVSPMAVVPVRNEWPLLSNKFTAPLYAEPTIPGDTIPPSSDDPTEPCLQSLGLSLSHRDLITKTLARDGFHLPYGFSTWRTLQTHDEFIMEDLTPTPYPGTPYEYFHAITQAPKPPPGYTPNDEPVINVLHVPPSALVKGGLETMSPRRYTGPLHMSASLTLHLHPQSDLYRPMFYINDEHTHTLISDRGVLTAAYIYNATLSISGHLTLRPGPGYTEVGVFSASDTPPVGQEDLFSMKALLQSPYAPITSESTLAAQTRDDPNPVLVSMSFADTVGLEHITNLYRGTRTYPVYTLKALLQTPPELLAQTLFWHRGSVIGATITVAAGSKLTIEEAYVRNTTFWLEDNAELHFNYCYVLETEVLGPGSTTLRRCPGYGLVSEGPVHIHDTNQFTPLVACFHWKDQPLHATLRPRAAGLLKRMSMGLVNPLQNPSVLLRQSVKVVRTQLPELIRQLSPTTQYTFLLTLSRMIMADPDTTLIDVRNKVFPYYMRTLDSAQALRFVRQINTSDETLDEEILTLLLKAL